MADEIRTMLPVDQAMRDAHAPATPPTLPDGTVLVSEAKPQTVQDAIRAMRDKAAAGAVTTPAAPEAAAVPGDASAAAPADGTATDGVDGADGADGDGAGEDEQASDAGLVFEVPARLPNGEPLRLAVPDQESLEALQRLHNGYMRGEQARSVAAEAREVIDEFEEFREGLRMDPLSTVESALSVEQGELLVRSLLTHPALFERLRDDLERVLSGDQDQIERVRERAEAQRAKLRDAARQELEGQRTIRQNARDVQSVIGRLVPESFTEEQREFFYRDARYDIQEWQSRNQRQIVPPNIVAQILAPRLRLYGVDPAARRERSGAQASSRSRAPAAAAAPVGATPAASTARPVERVQATAERRQLVAASAPGAQAPGRADPFGSIPKDADLKTAIATVRAIRRIG